MKFQEIYTSAEYLEINPTWHVEKSPCIVTQIVKSQKSQRLWCILLSSLPRHAGFLWWEDYYG